MAACCFDRSPEAVGAKLNKYRDDSNLHLYGWAENGEILGICGFAIHDSHVEVKHIAVAESARHRGVGRVMISVLQCLYPTAIQAETDDDAIGFYRKRGFDATVIEKYGMRRWSCVLPMQS